MSKKKVPFETPDGELWYMDPARAEKPRKKAEQKELPAAGGEAEETGTRMLEPGTENSSASVHKGHRQRMRERFRREGGFDSFADHEVLELLLMYAAPYKDMNPLAHKLLDSFGGLRGVLEARPEQLMKVEGMTENQATLMTMVVPLTRVWYRCAMKDPDQIANRRELENFCKAHLSGRRVEQFMVICVDARCRVIGCRVISEGSLSEVSAYPRLVMETALNYNAHSVFFCHNHPGGTCAPSTEDLTSTLQLQRMLNGVGILVLDHIIVAGVRTYSMAQHGDLEFGARGRKA